MTTFLSVAPHPDDEVLGAGPLSLALLDAGHDVHVLCASLGRPGQEARRRAEVEAAAAVGGWTLHLPPRPLRLGRGPGLAAAEAAVGEVVADLVGALDADVVIGPGPHDAHHAHEAMARAIRDTCAVQSGLRWWAWQVWGHLPVVDLVLPFGDDVLARARAALACHEGEVGRNDYVDLLEGAARAAGALGAERLLGFGSARPWQESNAVLLCESVATTDGWAHTEPRILDVGAPLAGVIDRTRSAAWLHAPSPYR